MTTTCDPSTTISAEDIGGLKADITTIDTVVESSELTTTTKNGVVIDTLAGRMLQLGYLPPVVYAAGITFTDQNDLIKTIDRSGVVYAPLPSAIPFTTSGTWGGDDENKFYVVQQTIFYQLASIAALRAQPAGFTDLVLVQGYYGVNTPGGGYFAWDAASTDADDGGLTILPTGHVTAGRWKRQYSERVPLSDFGCVLDGVTDDTVPCTSAINSGVPLVLDRGTLLTGSLATTTAASLEILEGAEWKAQTVADELTLGGDFELKGTGKMGVGILTGASVFVTEGITYGNKVVVQDNGSIFAHDVRFIGVDDNCITLTGADVYGFIDGIYGSDITFKTNVNFYGHLVFVYLAPDADVTIYNLKAKNIWGQGAVGVNRSRGVVVNGFDVRDTYGRGISVTTADLADGNGPLRCAFMSGNIERTGSLRLDSDPLGAVGCNGMYLTAYDGSPSKQDYYVSGVTIKDAAENGIEGHGIWRDIGIYNTGYRPALASPSKEGFYTGNNCDVDGVVLQKTAGRGFSRSTSTQIKDITVRNVSMSEVTESGVYYNQFGTDAPISNVLLENISIAENPTRAGTEYALFFRRTFSGTTPTYDNCRILNVRVGGKQLLTARDIYETYGGVPYTQLDIPNPQFNAREKQTIVVSGSPTTGNVYEGDMVVDVAAVGGSKVKTCERSGTYDARSASAGVTWSTGNNYFDATTSNLQVGDIVEVPGASGPGIIANTTRWVIVEITGNRHYVQGSIFTSGTAAISTVPPTLV